MKYVPSAGLLLLVGCLWLLVDREVADLAANLISLPLCYRRSMSGSARSRI